MKKIVSEPQMVYLDQAATSRPKADGVGEAMRSYIEDVCVNINRSTYASATDAAMIALETREQLCALFSHDDPTHAVFTPGQTWSINMALKGFLKPGDHVLVTPLEHNAVMRPLTQLLDIGVSFDRVPLLPDDRLDWEAAKRLVRPNTRLFVASHASNVSGTVFSLEEISAFCQHHAIPLVVDAAQSAGHYPIDLSETPADALCVPGHKGLCGPSGIGAMLLSPSFAEALTPLVSGGTGSSSASEAQPSFMPDKFESGTSNLPGVFGLHAALTVLLDEGVAARRARERALLERFLEGARCLTGIRLIGTDDLDRRTGVVSVDFLTIDNAEAADRLSREFGILTRCGLHCAPNAHKTFGTYPQGTVRFSMNSANTEAEIDAALAALREIIA